MHVEYITINILHKTYKIFTSGKTIVETFFKRLYIYQHLLKYIDQHHFEESDIILQSLYST